MNIGDRLIRKAVERREPTPIYFEEYLSLINNLKAHIYSKRLFNELHQASMEILDTQGVSSSFLFWKKKVYVGKDNLGLLMIYYQGNFTRDHLIILPKISDEDIAVNLYRSRGKEARDIQYKAACGGLAEQARSRDAPFSLIYKMSPDSCEFDKIE